jgi:hypothetical protein
MGHGIENLTSWASWVETTIIAAFCKAKETPCSLMQPVTDANGSVSIQPVAVGKVIADCLGMTTEKPHVIYDAATKTAIAGKIDPGAMSCEMFSTLLTDCPTVADASTLPTHILGYDPIPAREPKWYEFNPTQPLKFTANFAEADSYNISTSVESDQRIIIRRSIDTFHVRESSDFDAANTILTVGADGLYQIDYSVMLNVEYTALVGWVVALMTGIKVEPASGAASYEIRTDERPLYLNYQAAAGQDVILQCNVALALKSGDRIQPRVWFNNTYIPAGGGSDRRLKIWLNRSAKCNFSVFRVPDSEVVINGQ